MQADIVSQKVEKPVLHAAYPRWDGVCGHGVCLWLHGIRGSECHESGGARANETAIVHMAQQARHTRNPMGVGRDGRVDSGGDRDGQLVDE